MLEKWKYLIILVVGIVLSTYVFYSINEKYHLRNEALIESAVIKVELKLARELQKINLTLESMGVFIDNTPRVTQELFDEFTTPFLDELYGLQFLAWAPGRPAGRTESFSQSHFPIMCINPSESSRERLGVDLAANDSIRPLITRAVGNRKITYSNVIDLPGQDGSEAHFLGLLPVYDSLTNAVRGVVVGEYQVNEFVNKTLRFELAYLDLDIYIDKTPEIMLYSSIPAVLTDQNMEDRQQVQVNAADRTWDITILPKEPFTSYPHAFESYFVLFLGLATTALLLIVLRQRDNYSKRLISEVRMRTAELEESNRLKENLLREIHHRVKNNLQIASSLMNMQKRKLRSQEAISALEDSQARILAIALTHQKMYQDRDTKAVNLKEYLNDLISYQKKIAPNIRYSVNSPDVSIDLDKAVPLALITSELVTNAVKHAFTKETDGDLLEMVVTEQENDRVRITIQDNGKGLGDDFNSKQSTGLGFQIINSLCRQIAATLNCSSSDGARFVIEFENKI